MVEVYSLGNGLMLGDLFTAIAALVATNDYLALIKILFVIATLTVAIEITWTGRFTSVKRLFTIIVILYAAIMAKTDVEVIDIVDASNNSIVADVPAGLAAPLSVFTTIGYWGTSAFETIFSLPNDLRYQSNGLLFASRLADASTHFEITDVRTANNLTEFSQGCIYYGMLAGWFTIESVMEAGDIWNALPAAAFGNAVFVNYTDTAGNTSLQGCRATRNLLQADWASAIDEMQSVYGMRIFSEYSEATARARLLSSLPQSYNYIASISLNAADIVRQNAMINSLRRAFTNLANNSGATGAAQDYALAQAEVQQRNTYATLGALAGRMMSLFRNVLETLIYGVFPIAIAFIMIAILQGKAALMYLKLLFWLQMWPPLFAILNYSMSSYAAEGVTAAAMPAGGGSALLNMMTHTAMQQVNSDMSAMAGYLSWLIPMFSWAIVSGGGFAAAQLASALGSIAQSSGSKAAQDTSTGNISLGNHSSYNSRMFQTGHGPTMTNGLGRQVDSSTGATYSTSAGGIQTVNTMTNSAPMTATLSSSLKSSISTSASSSMQAAKNALSSFIQSTQSSFSNMQKLAQSSSKGTGTSDSSSTGQNSQFQSSFGQVDKLAEQFGNKHGMSKGQAASMLLAASVGTDKQVLGKVGALATGLSASGKLGFEGKSASKEDWEAARQFAKNNQFGEKWSAASSAGQQLAATQSQSSNDSLSKDLTAGFNRQNAATGTLQSSMTEAQAWQRLSSQMQESGGSGQVSAVKDLIRYGQSQGINVVQLAAQSANIGGNPGATTALQNLVNDFVQNKAATMARVGPAPSADGVRQANQANTAAVNAAIDNPSGAPAAGSIMVDAASKQAVVREMGADSGVPTSGTVESRSDQIRTDTAAQMATQASTIDAGASSMQTEGSNLKNDAETHTAIENQHHMAHATGQVVTAGVEMVTDAAGSLRQIGGQMMDNFTGGSEGSSNEGKSYPGREYDMPPPLESDSTSDKQGRQAWVNSLN